MANGETPDDQLENAEEIPEKTIRRKLDRSRGQFGIRLVFVVMIGASVLFAICGGILQHRRWLKRIAPAKQAWNEANDGKEDTRDIGNFLHVLDDLDLKITDITTIENFEAQKRRAGIQDFLVRWNAMKTEPPGMVYRASSLQNILMRAGLTIDDIDEVTPGDIRKLLVREAGRFWQKANTDNETLIFQNENTTTDDFTPMYPGGRLAQITLLIQYMDQSLAKANEFLEENDERVTRKTIGAENADDILKRHAEMLWNDALQFKKGLELILERKAVEFVYEDTTSKTRITDVSFVIDNVESILRYMDEALKTAHLERKDIGATNDLDEMIQKIKELGLY